MTQHQKITEEQIEKLATLSRMNISPEEKKAYASEIDAILAYVDQIQEVTTGATNVERKPEQYVQRNVLRDDIAQPLETDREALVRAAPASQDGYVKVKKILN